MWLHVVEGGTRLRRQEGQVAHRSLQEWRRLREAPACTSMMLVGCRPTAVDTRKCLNGTCTQPTFHTSRKNSPLTPAPPTGHPGNLSSRCV